MSRLLSMDGFFEKTASSWPGVWMRTALLLVDIQKDYFPGGGLELADSLEAGRKACQLLQCFRENRGLHIHVQHISLNPEFPFLLKGTTGSDIHDITAHFEGEPIVYKHYPNAFRETNLLDLLKGSGIGRLIITGMMTHLGVDATARAAVDLGFRVILVEDACAACDLNYGETIIPAADVHKTFLAAFQSYGKVMRSEEVIALLAAEQINALNTGSTLGGE